MKSSIIWIMLLLFGGIYSQAQQTIKGSVQCAGDGEKLVGATIYFLPGLHGTSTDAFGEFSITVPDSAKAFVVSYVGYENDTFFTFPKKFAEIKLREGKVLNKVDVVGERGSILQNMGPQIASTITEKGLQKSACCNLSESFETSGLADVSFADGVTGAKQIRLLGLDGRYVAITAENVPALRGLANSFGLAYIPGTFIESIQVSKGPGSVSSGYESMSGAINVEYKKPWKAEKLYVNGYLNSMARAEANIAFANRLPGNKWSTITQLHGSIFRVHNDRNRDGFLDVPWFRQLNGVHRWKYEVEKFEFQIGVKALIENREGGQAAYFQHGGHHQGQNLYGVKN